MSLQARLDVCRSEFESGAGPDVVAALRRSIAELSASGAIAQAVRAAEKAPLFGGRSRRGDSIRLSSLLHQGPVVLSFFRGAWCPFCTLELDALTQAHPDIQRLGATLIGLSPISIGDSDAGFPLLYDPGCRIAALYRVAFTLPSQFRSAYVAMGYPYRNATASSWVLPLPATYVVDSSGFVILSYVDADYTMRLEPADIITALRSLRAKQGRR